MVRWLLWLARETRDWLVDALGEVATEFGVWLVGIARGVVQLARWVWRVLKGGAA